MASKTPVEASEVEEKCSQGFAVRGEHLGAAWGMGVPGGHR